MNGRVGWEPHHSNWFLHPVEAPKRMARQVRVARERTLFFCRRMTGAKLPVEAVNIGGGPRWCKAGWLNLEEVTSVYNPVSFRFSAECRFPLADASIRLAYTSHCLEHLDDPTVDRIFSETHRVLCPSGEFVIKLPDFDEVLRRWAARDEGCVTDYRFNFNSIRHVWRANGIEENLDMKCAFIFCHYWNHAYGHHYAGVRRASNNAYIGPPRVPAEKLRAAAEGATPHEVSRRLRQLMTGGNDPDVIWGHQNAWGREELEALLVRHGFRSVSFDRDDIIRRFRSIPDIDAMDVQSMYCAAAKA